MIYNYITSVKQETVKKAILADSIFKQNIKSIKGLLNSIEVEFNSALSGSEELRLSSIISGLPLSDPSLLLDRNMEKIKKFSEKLISEFGKTKMAYTEIQIRALSSQLSEVTRLLSTRSLPTALSVINAMTPTPELLQSDIDYFSSEITSFLGSL